MSHLVKASVLMGGIRGVFDLFRESYRFSAEIWDSGALGIKNGPIRKLSRKSRFTVSEADFLRRQRRHINHEAVFHIAFQHTFVSVVNVRHADHFDVRTDVMFGAEIEHFLGFCNAADA